MERFFYTQKKVLRQYLCVCPISRQLKKNLDYTEWPIHIFMVIHDSFKLICSLIVNLRYFHVFPLPITRFIFTILIDFKQELKLMNNNYYGYTSNTTELWAVQKALLKTAIPIHYVVKRVFEDEIQGKLNPHFDERTRYLLFFSKWPWNK